MPFDKTVFAKLADTFEVLLSAIKFKVKLLISTEVENIFLSNSYMLFTDIFSEKTFISNSSIATVRDTFTLKNKTFLPRFISTDLNLTPTHSAPSSEKIEKNV